MNNKGFTLIEISVATAIFVLVTTVATGLFVSSLRAQRQALATQEVLAQTSYLMEYMSRALRMARKDLLGECIPVKLNYQFENNCLKFRNYQGDCQQFCLDGTRLKDENDNYLTSASFEVSSFNVDLSGQYQPPIDYLQPKITIFLDIKGKEQSKVKIQTTISQRNPDVRQ